MRSEPDRHPTEPDAEKLDALLEEVVRFERTQATPDADRFLQRVRTSTATPTSGRGTPGVANRAPSANVIRPLWSWGVAALVLLSLALYGLWPSGPIGTDLNSQESEELVNLLAEIEGLDADSVDELVENLDLLENYDILNDPLTVDLLENS